MSLRRLLSLAAVAVGIFSSICLTQGVSAMTCDSRHFACSDGTQCLPLSYRCDGQSDCRDGSDELNCTVSNVPAVAPQCRGNQYKCGGNSSQCLDSDKWCDTHVDCDNGVDERVCLFGTRIVCQPLRDHFKCADQLLCYNTSRVCDGHRDCDDGSDELPKNCHLRLPTTTTAPVTSTAIPTTSRPTEAVTSTLPTDGAPTNTATAAGAVAQDTNSRDAVLIGAGIGGGLLLIVICAVVVFFVVRANKVAYKNQDDSNGAHFYSQDSQVSIENSHASDSPTLNTNGTTSSGV